MTIIRWRTQPSLEKFLNEAFENKVEDNFNENCGCLPDTNIIKSKDHFTIEMAAPGLQKSDFKINVDDKMLTISYEPDEKKEETFSGKYLRREFNQEAFSRHFTLPETCDTEKIKAKYENGVLRVYVPFEDPEKTKISRAISVN